MKHYKTAESVTKGHPDKLCDYIADSILDSYLQKDPESRVAVEVMATKGLILVAGEVTSTAKVHIRKVVKYTLRSAGYTPSEFRIKVRLHKQSPDIARGVNRSEDLLGAGDQGIVYGYATDETPGFLPLALVLARRLTSRLEEVRENSVVSGLKPDGKCLVTVEYEEDEASRIHSVVLSTQHDESITTNDLRKEVLKHVIHPVLNNILPFDEEDILVNPTGRFVIGGPAADTGLTGRKLAVDTYGGLSKHGGGAFSGKDPTKVDRSGAYMARLIARSVVSAGLAKECEVSIAYAIGKPDPLYWDIDCFGTEKKDLETIREQCETLFPLSVLPMIQYLRLRRGSYASLAVTGHFGDGRLPWENDLAGLFASYGGESMKMTEHFEKVPIDKLVPYARNARTHSKEQILQLRSSIREFGFINPCLIDKDYNILAGHGRVLAAKEEGLTELPCVFVEHLTEAQKRAYILADNRLALNAGWDEEMLSIELSELEGADFDLDLLGFTDAELHKLLGEIETEEDDFDLTAALEEASFVKAGDVWTVGKHRLICGDATKREDVQKLMDGKKANLILTDPPYAVSYESASGLSIKNDNLKADEFYDFLLSSFKNMIDVSEAGASAYVFHADTEGLTFRKAFEDAGFHLSGVCIWAKDSLVLGRSPYQWSHEPILFGWNKKGKHKWYAGRAEKTVWQFAKPKKNENHPTSKPIDLLSYPIQNSSQANSIVLDLFGGSGSTLIACEQTDRICYMAEIDDKYASVILRRYVEYKNGDATGVFVERDGKKIPYEKLVKTVKS